MTNFESSVQAHRPGGLLVRVLRSPLALTLLFLVAGLLVYAPALHGGLIWDDTYLVGENPFYKSPVFTLEVFRHWLFLDSFSTYYRPVQNISYMFDYWLWAGNPFGYHLTNVVIHSLSGLLFFFLLRRIFSQLLAGVDHGAPSWAPTFALLTAVIWTVHPMHSAGVAYISGRADSLASLFSLIAWLLLIRARETQKIAGRVILFVFAAATMLVALCAKEIALIWLLLFLGHLFVCEKSIPRAAKISILIAVVALFGAYFFLHSLPEDRTPIEDGSPHPFAGRILLMLRAVGDYTGLIFWPSHLMMDRSISSAIMYDSRANWHALLRYEYLSILGALALAAFAWFALRNLPGRRLRAFGVAWFIVAFLPISNLFPLNAQIAEHWIYLASIGYLTFLAGCLLLLPDRARRLAMTAAAFAAVGLGARTYVRATDWSDAETFYLRTIEAGGGTPRVRGNLANIYGQRGDCARQEKLLREILEHFPNYTPARIALGACLNQQGRAAEAATLLDLGQQQSDTAARKFPRTWTAALSLARLRAGEGRKDDAVAILDEARKKFPGTWDIARMEADLVQQTQGASPAVAVVADYTRERWWHQDSWLMLGRLRFAAQDTDGAAEAFKHAARLDIHDPRPFADIARLELTRNRLDAACAAQQTAIARDPDQPSRYVILAGILEKLGRTTEAAAALRQANALRASVRPEGA
jgi:tetratricopeptide (TPR) repeat protein